jgi:hypothetical protein
MEGDVAALLLFLLAGFCSVLVIKNLRQANMADSYQALMNTPHGEARALRRRAIAPGKARTLMILPVMS